MSDIFLSYSSEDREWVRRLADRLLSVGYSVWWDRTIPAGKTFTEVISQALDDARCVVVVWSEHSVKSNWVREEAEEGRRRGILVPVFMHAAPPPLGFRSIQAADLSSWNGEEDTGEFRRLVDDITLVIGPPTKPDMQDKRPSPNTILQVPGRATYSEQKLEDTATAEPSDVSYHSTPVVQRSKLTTVPHLVLGITIALLAGLLMYANRVLDTRRLGAMLSINDFIAPNVFTLGLFLATELADRLSRPGLGKKVLAKAGAIVGVELCLVFILTSLSVGYGFRVVLGWIVISVLVVIATATVKAHWMDTPAKRLLLGVITGAIGGALWGTFAFYVWNLWLVANGILLATLIGLLEFVAAPAQRNDLVKRQLIRGSS
jgi:hypothetical protein